MADAPLASSTQEIMKAGADHSTTKEEVDELLLENVLVGNIAEIHRLINDQGACPDQCDKDGTTLLHWAAQNKFPEVAQFLIQRGVDVNRKNRAGQSSLDWACRRNAVGVIVELLKAGADVNSQDIYGLAPIHWAAQEGNVDVVICLFIAGANIDLQGTHDLTPLHWAISKGHQDMCMFLLERGCKVDLLDSRARTPLHWAALSGMMPILRPLMKKGLVAYLDTPDSEGLTPAALAKKYGHTLVAKKLETWKKNIDSAFASRSVPGVVPESSQLSSFTGVQIYFFVTFSATLFHHYYYVVPATPSNHLYLLWLLSAATIGFMAYLPLTDPGYIPSNNYLTPNMLREILDRFLKDGSVCSTCKVSSESLLNFHGNYFLLFVVIVYVIVCSLSHFLFP